MSSNRLIRVLFVLCVILGIGGAISQFFSVRELRCSYTSGEACESEARELFLPLLGKPFFTTDFKLEAELLTENTSFRFNSLQKRLPNVLEILVSEIPPAYELLFGDTQTVISSSGHIFPSDRATTAAQNTLQITFFSEPPITNEAVDSKTHETLLQLSTALTASDLAPEKIEWISAQEIRISLPELPVVILDADQVSQKIQTLETIIRSGELDRVERDEVQLRELDLRFKLPVLRTSQ